MRRILFTLHLYTGLALGAVLALSGLTGSLLVFDREIEAWLRAEPPRAAPVGAFVAPDLVLRQVAAVRPDDAVLYLGLPRNPEDVYELYLASGERAYVDPYRGAVLDIRAPAESAVGFVRQLHIDVFAGRAGEVALGVMGILTQILLISGIIVWWPGLRRLHRGFRLRWREGSRILLGDAHRVLGAAGLALMMLATTTGVAIIFYESTKRVIYWATASPEAPPRPASTPPEDVRGPVSLAGVLDEAVVVLPGARVTWLYLPQTPTAPIVVRMKLPQELHPNGRSFAYFDRYSGRLLRADSAADAPAGALIYDALYPLHTGEAAGLAMQVLVALAGLLPVMLFVTGLWTWLSRTARRRRPRGGRRPCHAAPANRGAAANGGREVP